MGRIVTASAPLPMCSCKSSSCCSSDEPLGLHARALNLKNHTCKSIFSWPTALVLTNLLTLLDVRNSVILVTSSWMPSLYVIVSLKAWHSDTNSTSEMSQPV